MSEVNKSVLVSSPGKILIAGGYLVLEGVYSGSVIGSNAKFLVGIKTKEGDDKTITVNSPQFEDLPWNYNFTDAGVAPKLNQSKNPFLDITIPLVYKYLLGLGKTFEELNKGLNLYCFSDNDFYSQVDRLKEANLPQTLEGLSKLEPCGKLSTTLGDVAKTGLGSSATLVTSLVGALLSYHLNLSHLNDHKQIVHNLAQLSHSVAQGKLGSGFDVSAAAFGNQIYSTFQSTWLKSWIQTYSSVTASEFSQTVNNLELWDTKVTSFSLPSGIYLTLADIQHGSHTPSMVTKLLNWRKSNPEVATPIWQGLNKKNLLVTELLIKLQGLYEMNKEGYERSLNWASSISFDKWQESCPSALNTEVIDTLVQIRQTFAQVRSYFRELTEYADVPIEPVEQTQLLNKMEALPGVLIAGVPGAGGYDAVFTLTIGKSPIANLQDLWQANSVIPLLQGGAQQGLGVQLEPKTSDYYNILNSITAANNSQSPPKL